MPINTNVPTSLLTPSTYHTFFFRNAGNILEPLPLRIALVGMAKGGTAVNEQVYEVEDAVQADALFGVGTELSIMCRMALACFAKLGRGPRLFAVGIDEPAASAAATRTFTVAGTATADGNAHVRLAGRDFIVGIRVGDVANTVSASLFAAMQRNNENNPFSVAHAAPVVTAAYRTTGTNGNDLAGETVETVPGITITVANGVAGTGTPDITDALAALAAGQYDGIAVSTHIGGDITIINADYDARWASTSKSWRYYFMAERGSIATATALAAAANRKGVIVGSYEGSPSLPGEIATALCFAVNASEQPNATYNGRRLPIHPPPAATAYTPTELETALAAGLTPLVPVLGSNGAVVEGESKIVRLVTTKTTSGGLPYSLERDIGSSRTGVYYARQLDIQAEQRFGADANPDGVFQTEDTLDQVEDMTRAIARELGERSVLINVEEDLALLRTEIDDVASGRTNADIYYTPAPGQHQLAFRHNVQIL